MRRRTLARLAALALAAAGFAMAVATLALLFVPLRPGVANPYPPGLVVVAIAVYFLITPVLGVLLATRRPRNPTGWLFLAMSFWFALGFCSDALARHLPPSAALGLFATVASDMGGLWLTAFMLLVVFFPDGRLPGRRWRVAPALLVGATVAQLVASLFAANGGIQPPIAGLPLPLARPDWQPALDLFGAFAGVLLVAGLASTVALLAVRFRRAHGVERQQLKWFLWAVSVVASILVFSVVVSPIDDAAGNAAWMALLGSLVLLPMSATAAILRYRLFDIDLLINRTLVYGALSGVLVAVYAASVLSLSQLVAPFMRSSSLTVAASTLLVAALFQPARRSIQSGVDRRFYRARYDAARELDAFRGRLRGQLDPHKLSQEVVEMTIRTMQPTAASVWVRDASSRSVTVSERAARRMEP